MDGTQSIGALPIDVTRAGIDVIAAHGDKWLMAGCGLGVVHLSERAIERIHPTYVGRLSVTAGFEDLDYRLTWRPGAARYQTGGLNWLTLAAFCTSAELILRVGPARTERHPLALTERLLAAVAERGSALRRAALPRTARRSPASARAMPRQPPGWWRSESGGGWPCRCAARAFACPPTSPTPSRTSTGCWRRCLPESAGDAGALGPRRGAIIPADSETDQPARPPIAAATPDSRAGLRRPPGWTVSAGGRAVVAHA